jgi:hypothetical protein
MNAAPGNHKPRAFHQLLLRQYAGLQSSDRCIDPDILFLGAKVEEEKAQDLADQVSEDGTWNLVSVKTVDQESSVARIRSRLRADAQVTPEPLSMQSCRRMFLGASGFDETQ